MTLREEILLYLDGQPPLLKGRRGAQLLEEAAKEIKRLEDELEGTSRMVKVQREELEALRKELGPTW